MRRCHCQQRPGKENKSNVTLGANDASQCSSYTWSALAVWVCTPRSENGEQRAPEEAAGAPGEESRHTPSCWCTDSVVGWVPNDLSRVRIQKQPVVAALREVEH